MARQNKEEKRTLENILRLETIKDRVSGPDLKNLEIVLEDLRKSAGNTVSKTNAAEILKVSRQTVDRWVHQGLMPVKKRANGRQGIPRDSFERLVREVNEAEDVQRTRSFVAQTLRQVADDIAPLKKQTVQKSTAEKKTTVGKTTKASGQKASTKKK